VYGSERKKKKETASVETSGKEEEKSLPSPVYYIKS
jgi:hypothetical protein